MNRLLLLLIVPWTALLPVSGQQLISNPTFQGTSQSDLDLGGHALSNGGFNTASHLVQLNASAQLPALDGSLLTSLAWSQIHGAPTSLAGYGIADPILLSSGSYANPSWLTALAWSKVTSPPTSLAGYGITDPVLLSSGSYSNPAWLTSLAWSKLSGKPTTLSGYGITDSVTVQGNTFNGNSQLVQTTSGGALPALSGANLTALNGSNVASGTVAAARLPAAVAYTNAAVSFSSSLTAAGDIMCGTSGISISSHGDGTPPVAGRPWFRVSDAGNDSLAINAGSSGALIKICLDLGGGLMTRHIIGGSSAPGISAGTGAGTSPTVSVSGTDLSGTISVTTGTSPAASATVATLTFSSGYGAGPVPVLSPGNAAAAALSGNAAAYGTTTSSTLLLKSGSTALAASTAYVFYYHLLQ